MGGCFSAAGFRVEVRLTVDNVSSRQQEIVVVDTETRNSQPSVARETVARVASSFGRSAAFDTGRFDLHFKKIDSTLRGPIGHEVSGLMRALALDNAVIAPAFPAQGRTTVGGRQLVRGQPVEKSPAGSDPAYPVSESHLPTLLRAQTGQPVALVTLDVVRQGRAVLEAALRDALAQRQLCVVDAETDEQLNELAAVLLGLASRVLAVGTTGLASSLVRRLKPLRPTAPSHPPQASNGAGVLVVCGSLHPASLRQVEYLGDRASLFSAAARAAGEDGNHAVERRQVQRVATALAHGDVLLSSSSGDGRGRGPRDEEVIIGLAALAGQAVEACRPRGLVLTGGETAYRVLQALEADGMQLTGEVLPGVPVGSVLGGRCNGLPSITKAGGFGEPDVLSRAVEYLGKQP